MTIAILRRRGLGKTSIVGRADREGVRGSPGITGFCKHNTVQVRNWVDSFPEDTKMIIRWGCTSNIPRGIPVLNSAKAIHVVSDKSGFRLKLSVEAPNTIPKTWFTPDNLKYPLTAPVVVRRSPHYQGRYLHLCQDEAAVRAACSLYEEFYISEYITKVSEHRITFVCGRVAWVAKKTPGNPDDVAWNVNQGGRFDNVRWGDWNLGMIKVAREAFILSGLHFGAVDIMTDADGRHYVLEINSAPSQTSNYRQSCLAKAFDYTYEHGPANLAVEHYENWRNVIHPALRK